jgi:hypothetical protein
LSKLVARRGAVCARCIVPLLVVIAVASFVALGGGRRRTAAAPAALAPTAVQARVRANYAALPLAFEENLGQTDSQVKYLARGDGYTLFLTPNDAVFSLRSGSADAASASRRTIVAKNVAKNPAPRPVKTESTAVVHMQLTGARLPATVAASDQMPGKSNYFIGNDPSKWRTAVQHYARVSYQDVYPGVNLAFHGAQRQPEFDFVVAPGADPAPIGFHFTGARAISTDGSGNLEIFSTAGNILLHKPVAYQELGGRRQLVDAQFVLQAGNKVGFALGNYDRSRELVIDPSVTYLYSTYLGGSGDDEGQGTAFDSSGNAYVTGQTASPNFPGASNHLTGTANVFVTKIAADGSSLIYSTYVGGTGPLGDSGNAIAVDQTSGNAYVAGGTSSTDFPTTAGGGEYQSSLMGAAGSAFVIELNSSGGLTYGTYLGGTTNSAGNPSTDTALGIALASDGSGNVFVVGKAGSMDFPTLNPIQSYVTGSASSGFLTELNSSGSALVYSTYLGGSSDGDVAGAVAAGSSGEVYVTGQTFSAAFHTTHGAYQSACNSCTSGNSNAFVTALNITSTASTYTYSTFLGGSGSDAGDGIAVDSTGAAYVTGTTKSSSFPTTPGAYQTTYGGNTDAFVTKLNPGGSALVYSTYLGGSSFDTGASIALDSGDDAYVTGQTNSSTASGGTPFPTVNATQPTLGGGYDAFVTEINPSGSQPIFSTYLGGSGDEDAGGNYGAIAVDATGASIYVTGNTASTDFPAPGPFPYPGGDANGGPSGTTDAFVVKYTQPAFALTASALSPANVNAGSSATSTVTISPLNSFTGSVALSCGVTSAPTGASNPPSCKFSSGTVTGGSGSSTLNVTTASSTTAGAYTITVTGVGPSTTQRATLTLTVGATFSLSASALSPSSVNPGSSATSTISVAATGGFSGSVALSCAVSPMPALAPTCTVGPASASAPATLTVSTSAPSALLRSPVRKYPSGVSYALLLPVAGMSLMGLKSRSNSPWRRLLGLLVIGVILSALILMPACGGSSHSGGGGGGGAGTPAGSYTITVTGTATGATQTGTLHPLTLTVN